MHGLLPPKLPRVQPIPSQPPVELRALDAQLLAHRKDVAAVPFEERPQLSDPGGILRGQPHLARLRLRAPPLWMSPPATVAGEVQSKHPDPPPDLHTRLSHLATDRTDVPLVALQGIAELHFDFAVVD